MRTLEKKLKRALIQLIGPLFASRSANKGVDRVVFVRVDDRLGNLILLSPAIEWLHTISPDTRIDLIASRPFASIYADDPRISRLFALNKKRQKVLFPTFLNDLVSVGRQRYDTVLECSDRNAFSFNSALYALASRAPRRIGFANELATHYLTEEVPIGDGRHAARDPLLLAGTLLERTPPAIEACRLLLHLPVPCRIWKDRLDHMRGADPNRIVGMHIGGRGRKRWPLERYVALSVRLIESGFRPWIFRGPMEAEGEALFRGVLDRGGVLVPRADIVQIGQAMACCRIVIAPDTGPMHLASAVGSRTLAIFLDSDVERYRPIAPEDKWIDARGEDLSVSRVFETALSMLRETGRVEAE